MAGYFSRLMALLTSDKQQLQEAAAYRITPDYLYVFRKAKIGNKVVQVRIKHANVHKYWDDLVDPNPNSPLSHLVIGTIPKTYNKPSDLKPKDPTKSVKDLMDKGDKETPHVRVALAAEQEDTTAQAQSDAEVVSKYVELNPREKRMLTAIFSEGGNELEGAIKYVGGEDTEDLESALELAMQVIEKVNKKKVKGIPLVQVTTTDDVDTVQLNPALSKPVPITAIPQPSTVAPISAPPKPVEKAVEQPVQAAPVTPDTSLPPYSSLKLLGNAAGIGGAGWKMWAEDANGKRYLVKIGKSKSGSKAEPFKVKAQTLFAQVAGIVRDGKTVPVGEVPGSISGYPATYQPWLELDKNAPTLEGTSPAALTDSEKKDVAEEHLVDWLMSQHDSHPANLVRRKDGSVVSIDKEQGFKYFPNDKLDTNYHPNAVYGENPPYYNQFWGDFAAGKFDFDPKVLEGAIKRAEGISDSDYLGMLKPYADISKDPKSAAHADFLSAALSRKKNLRSDFEKFLTGLYEKRTKKKGAFTFAGGFVPEGQEKPAPTPALEAPAASATAGELSDSDKLIMSEFEKAMQKHDPLFSAVAHKAKKGKVVLAPSVGDDLWFNSFTTIDADALHAAFEDTQDSYPATGTGLVKRLVTSKLSQGHNWDQLKNALTSGLMLSSGEADSLIAAVLTDVRLTYQSKTEDSAAGAQEFQAISAKQPWLASAVSNALYGDPSLPLTPAEQGVVALLYNGGADSTSAMEAAQKVYGKALADYIITRLSKAGIYNVKVYDGKGDLAGPPFESDFVDPSKPKKKRKDQGDALPSLDMSGHSPVPTASGDAEFKMSGSALVSLDLNNSDASNPETLSLLKSAKSELMQKYGTSAAVKQSILSPLTKGYIKTDIAQAIAATGTLEFPEAYALVATVLADLKNEFDLQKKKKKKDPGDALLLKLAAFNAELPYVPMGGGNLIHPSVAKTISGDPIDPAAFAAAKQAYLGGIDPKSLDYAVAYALLSGSSYQDVAKALKAFDPNMPAVAMPNIDNFTDVYLGKLVDLAVGTPASPTPTAPAITAPTVAPAPTPTKLEVPYVSNSDYAEIFKKVDLPLKSSYAQALKNLVAFKGDMSKAVEALVAQGFDQDESERRVKYAAKRVKAAGGWPAVGFGSGSKPVDKTPAVASDVASTAKTIPLAVKTATGVEVKTTISPAQTGPIGALNAEMVKAADPKMVEAPKPPTPPGYPEPAPGMMWQLTSAKDFKDAHLYKEKPPQDANGQAIASSPFLVLKFNGSKTTADAINKYLEQIGSPPTTMPGNEKFPAGVSSNGGYFFALVDKAAWQKAQAENKTLDAVQVKIPPPEPVVSETPKFATIPKTGQLANPLAIIGLAALDSLKESKEIGYGKAFATDGGSVELLNLHMQRCNDSKGEFYRFNFKIRDADRSTLGGGVNTKFMFNTMTYDAATDSWVQGSVIQSDAFKFESRKWSDGNSTVHLGTPTGTSHYTAKNMVVADVRVQAGETLKDALKRTLSLASPQLAEKIVKDPTGEDVKRVKLSALLWALAPQASDKLQDNARTIEALTERLNDFAVADALIDTANSKGIYKAGAYTDHREDPKKAVASVTKALQNSGMTPEAIEQIKTAALKDMASKMESVRLEETAMGHISPVLPGRSKTIRAKQKSVLINYGTSDDLDVIISQVLGGSISMCQRLMIGTSQSATSGSTDFKTGGGDYVFTKAINDKTSSDYSGWGGSTKMVYDPSEFDRLDCFLHTNDGYGNTNPDSSSYGDWKGRKTLETHAASASEICFKQGISSRKLLKISVGSSYFAGKLIKEMQQRGITEINGMTPEELVYVGSNAYKDYKALYEPAGY